MKTLYNKKTDARVTAYDLTYDVWAAEWESAELGVAFSKSKGWVEVTELPKRVFVVAYFNIDTMGVGVSDGETFTYIDEDGDHGEIESWKVWAWDYVSLTGLDK